MTSDVLTAWIAAIAGLASAVIYFLTLQSVNEQTKISGKQFDVLDRQFEDRYRPYPTAQLSKYRPSSSSMPGTMGTLTVTISNSGSGAFRVLKLFAHNGNSRTPLKDRGALIIPPGSSRDVTNVFYLPPEADWSPVELTCEIEAANGKQFVYWTKWTMRHSPPGSEHELLDEQLDEKEKATSS
jgi:hypothetical protein